MNFANDPQTENSIHERTEAHKIAVKIIRSDGNMKMSKIIFNLKKKLDFHLPDEAHNLDAI